MKMYHTKTASLLLCIIACTHNAMAVPVPDYSPIIQQPETRTSTTSPPDSIASCDLGLDQIIDLVEGIIEPKLLLLIKDANMVFNHDSLSSIAGNYNAWRRDDEVESYRTILAWSTYRMKCIVHILVNVVKTESLRYLVSEEEPNFAQEFQSILENSNILLDLQTLARGDSRITPGCFVATNVECITFDGLERDVQVKSIANEVKILLASIQGALNDLLYEVNT